MAAQRGKVTADLVAEVAGARFGRDARRRRRPRQAGAAVDLAVLVHTNKTGDRIRHALVTAGIPAVMLGATSVFATGTAREWLLLLQALEQPRSARIRHAALTASSAGPCPISPPPTTTRLAELTQPVRSWSRVLASRGVAALVEVITSQTDLAGRLLGEPGGERRLTDLRHIGQLLHRAAAGPARRPRRSPTGSATGSPSPPGRP